MALRPIVENIGLDWAAQYSRIKRHPVLSTSVVVMTTQMPGDDQQRNVFCLPLSMLNGWLFGVDVNRVREEIRPKLIRYQTECFEVLAQHFMPAQRPHNPALDYDRISPAQAQDLKELVHSVVDAKVQGFAETWARLHKKFRVNSYLELPATRFDEARDYLLGKLPEAATAPALPDMNRTRAAFDAAAQAAASVQTAVFNAVLAGNDEWKFDRWLLAFIDDSVKAAPAHVWRLNQGDFIANWPKLVKDVATGECMCSNAELLDMAAACMQRLQQRGGPARLAA